MTINITDPKCYAAIARVEGMEWVRSEANHLAQVAELGYPLSENSFTGAILQWHERGGATIYGAGGWNRYHIREDGSLTFSKFHCPNEETRHKAAEVGFNVG